MTGLERGITLILWISFCALKSGMNVVYADVTSDWQRSDETSTASIDHSLWQEILDRYLETADSSGINRFDYGRVEARNRKVLKSYLSEIQALYPRSYNRNEQMAYWINLYNALTIDLVLGRYELIFKHPIQAR